MFFVESVEAEFETTSAIPAITEETDIVSVGYEMAAEVELFSNAITEGVGLYELNNIGNEDIYTEGILSSIKDKVIAIWDKIRKLISNLFRKFMTFFDKIFKSDKDFYNKYKKDFDKNAPHLSADKEWTFEGFDKLGMDQTDRLDSFYKEIDGKVKKYLEDGIRGTNGQFTKITPEKMAEFTENVKTDIIDTTDEYISKEKDKSVTIKGTDVYGLNSTIKDVLMYDKSKIDKKEKEIKKLIDNYQKGCISEIGKEESNYSAKVSRIKTLASASGNAITKVASLFVDQVKSQKSAARKLFYAGVKATAPKAESSAFRYTDFESYFNF